jgi:hypothetical protein
MNPEPLFRDPDSPGKLLVGEDKFLEIHGSAAAPTMVVDESVYIVSRPERTCSSDWISREAEREDRSGYNGVGPGEHHYLPGDRIEEDLR